MKKIILTLLVVLISSNATAEWTRVGGGDDNSDLYVDLDTIRRNGNKVKLWSMQNFKALNGETKPKHFSNKFYWEFDCKEEMARIPAIMTYSGKKGSGRVVDSDYNTNEAWQPVPPDTTGQIIFDAGCNTTIGAHKWIFVKKVVKKMSHHIYFDPSSIQKNEDIASMWVLFDSRSGDHTPNKDNYSMTFHREYDCKERQSRDISRQEFSANMGAGRNYASSDFTLWKPIVIGTLSNELWTLACG